MSVYRQHENPYRLKKYLSELQAHRWKMIDHGADEDAIINLDEAIAELKDRINQAWADEYEED